MRYTNGLYAIYREYFKIKTLCSCEGDCPKIIRFPTHTLTRETDSLDLFKLAFFVMVVEGSLPWICFFSFYKLGTGVWVYSFDGFKVTSITTAALQ